MRAATNGASWASSPAVRSVMRGNRKRDTRPEVALRRAVHRQGLRYRVATRPIDVCGTADLVFAGSRVAVFVDGCFWHACPTHFAPPQTNAAYWGPKIARNRARDEQIDAVLREAGWRPVRVWEHEDPIAAATRVIAIVRSRQRSHVTRRTWDA